MFRMHESRSDKSGLLQFHHNGRSNAQAKGEIKFKFRNFLVGLLGILDASNPTVALALLTFDTRNFIRGT